MSATKLSPLTVSFVVPIYNNASTLIGELTKCEKILKNRCKKYEIIICNDGSTDDTNRLLQKYSTNRKNVTVLTHSTNLGIAPTLRHLYRSAKMDYVFLFSVDGDWNTKDIDRMINTIVDKRADLVLGVRTQTNYPPYRRVVSFLYNFLPFLLFGVKTYDAGSIKIFRKSLFNEIPLQSKGVFFEAELIIKATKRGFSVVTCNHIHYHKRDPNSGKGGTFMNVLASFKDMLHLRLTVV